MFSKYVIYAMVAKLIGFHTTLRSINAIIFHSLFLLLLCITYATAADLHNGPPNMQH